MATLERQAERLAALGHPVRLAILRHVVQGERTGTPAGEIQQALGIPASTLSHHLGTLSAAGLVKVERQGTTLRYRADFDTLRALTAFIWEDCCRRESSTAEAACCAPDPAAGADTPVAIPAKKSVAWTPDFD